MTVYGELVLVSIRGRWFDWGNPIQGIACLSTSPVKETIDGAPSDCAYTTPASSRMHGIRLYAAQSTAVAEDIGTGLLPVSRATSSTSRIIQQNGTRLGYRRRDTVATSSGHYHKQYGAGNCMGIRLPRGLCEITTYTDNQMDVMSTEGANQGWEGWADGLDLRQCRTLTDELAGEWVVC